jgi:hypothetical protein
MTMPPGDKPKRELILCLPELAASKTTAVGPWLTAPSIRKHPRTQRRAVNESSVAEGLKPSRNVARCSGTEPPATNYAASAFRGSTFGSWQRRALPRFSIC